VTTRKKFEEGARATKKCSFYGDSRASMKKLWENINVAFSTKFGFPAMIIPLTHVSFIYLLLRTCFCLSGRCSFDALTSRTLGRNRMFQRTQYVETTWAGKASSDLKTIHISGKKWKT
jgi:hypothetical protein